MNGFNSGVCNMHGHVHCHILNLKASNNVSGVKVSIPCRPLGNLQSHGAVHLNSLSLRNGDGERLVLPTFGLPKWRNRKTQAIEDLHDDDVVKRERERQKATTPSFYFL